MSTIPAALSALTVGFASALPDNFEIAEGELPTATPEQDYCIVGFDSEHEQDDPVMVAWRPQNAAATVDDESYDVLCLLSVWTGDDDVPTTRARLFTYLSVLRAWLAQNRDLGVDGVHFTHLSQGRLAQPITGAGATATLRFTVHIDAVTE